MQAEFDNMVKEMLGYGVSDEIPETELARLTKIYAYSPFIQYLFSRHLKEKNDPRYGASIARTALYFSNPHWLNHQLRNGKRSLVVENKSTDSNITSVGTVENFSAFTEEKNIPDSGNFADSVIEESIEIVEPVTESDLISDSSDDENKTEIFSVFAEEEIINDQLTVELLQEIEAPGEPDQLQDFLVPENDDEDFSDPDQQYLPDQINSGFPVEDNSTIEIITAVISEDDRESIYEGEDPDCERIIGSLEKEIPSTRDEVFDSEITSPIADPETGDDEGETVIIIEEEEQITIVDNLLPVIDSEPDPASESAYSTTEQVTEDSELDEINNTDKVPDSDEKAMKPEPELRMPGLRIESNLPIPEKIGFEPLHTVDYFASQGIKLSVEEESKDQLSNRLKSFTEWLKSMKKIHPEKLSRELDEKMEMNIKTDAEQSNDLSEVLTETMAEVLQKQGLIEKALEVYEKLSLLNPSKSDYFAAKISALKAIGI